MKRVTLLLVLTLLAVLSFTASNKLYAQSPSPSTYLSQWSKAQDDDKTNPATIRLTLNRLLMEHAILTSLHLRALYDGRNTDPTRMLLADNAAKIQDVFVSNSNISSEQFYSIWDEHMRQYERYTVALKNNDANGMTDARNRLNDLANQFGSLLDRNNRAITGEMLATHMRNHTNGTLAIMDAYAPQDHDQIIYRTKTALDQAKEFADMLAAAFTNNR